MLHEYRKILGTHIVHQTEGSVLALVNDIIIHPDTGKVEAFWVKSISIPIANAILRVDDILEWKKNIYVRDERAITDPADIIRVSEILSRNTFFIGNQVKSESGQYLGKVYDLSFDGKSFSIKQLFTQKIFLFFAFETRIFDYSSVIEVLPEYITVKNMEAKKEKAEEGAGQPLFDV